MNDISAAGGLSKGISHLQDFTNARYREANSCNLEQHEHDVRLLLDVLLNGMIERTDDSHAEA